MTKLDEQTSLDPIQTVDGFTVEQWDAATDAVAEAMEVEGCPPRELVRIAVVALGLAPISPETILRDMLEKRS